ncbi:MAG: hypothetical protein ABSF44_09075 [Candidatus Bathyarchaeia archaeon]
MSKERKWKANWYQIQTTPELDGVKYITKNIEIVGSFVKFDPDEIISKSMGETGSSEIEDTTIFLPERAIKRIVYSHFTLDKKE